LPDGRALMYPSTPSITQSPQDVPSTHADDDAYGKDETVAGAGDQWSSWKKMIGKTVSSQSRSPRVKQ
jgi:hypothetical protein